MNGFEVRALHRNASGVTEIRAYERQDLELIISAREPVRPGDTIIVRDVERFIDAVRQHDDVLIVTLGDTVRR